jgi:putative intracellular protease/amidase
MEKKNVCYLFVFDGYADWEPALVVGGLTRYSDFDVKTFSFDGLPVRSMGNILVQPDLSLREVDAHATDLILLPGGTAWEEGRNDGIMPFLEDVQSRKCTLAAICAATTVLARLGYLDEVHHTSNGEGYLKHHVAEYKGEPCYINEPAVADENIITANGAGMIEFAYEIFRHIGMLNTDDLEIWLRVYKSGGMVSTPTVQEVNQVN